MLRALCSAIGLMFCVFRVEAQPSDTCDAGLSYLHTSSSVHEFQTEIARSPEQRARGLMFREALAADHAMLFVFEAMQPRAFWMRNTLIPLDILYFDQAGQLVSFIKSAEPLDETPLPSVGPAQYVLEINGGLARKLGVSSSTVLQHVEIPQQSAALPCL